jgi:hypothetical protein
MKALLQRVHFICNVLHRVQTPITGPLTVNIRVFLAAYMIHVFPNNVFDQMTPMVRNLRDSAKRLLESFEASVRAAKQGSLAPAIAGGATADFGRYMNEYMRDFRSWKEPDEMRLLTRIMHALKALNDAFLQVCGPVGWFVCLMLLIVASWRTI